MNRLCTTWAVTLLMIPVLTANAQKNYLHWKTSMSEHLIIYYSPQSSLNDKTTLDKFIAGHERAISNTISVLQEKIRLPPKIYMYVYEDNNEAYPYIHRLAGHADPEIGVIHTRLNQTYGHELTHVISWRIGHAIKFLSEGLAVALDMSGYNHYAKAKEYLSSRNVKRLSTLTLMNNLNENEDWYPLAGGYVSFLIQKYGIAQFKKLWITKSEAEYEHAVRRIYHKSPRDLDLEFVQFLNAGQ